MKPLRGRNGSLKPYASVAKCLSYPFPLREDVTVVISDVPRDMSIAEAERLAAFIKTLATDGNQPRDAAKEAT